MRKESRSLRQRCIHFSTLLLLMVALAIMALLGKAYLDGKFQSVAAFQQYIAGFGTFAPLFLTVFQAIQVVLPILPGFLGCAVGSVMFGPLVGFLCNYAGISAGSILAFLLAKKYGAPLIRDLFPSEKYKKWSDWASTSKSYTAFLFLAMVLPLFPDDYLCYFSGITEMKAKRFIWIIILGKPWCILAYSLGFSLIQ